MRASTNTLFGWVAKLFSPVRPLRRGNPLHLETLEDRLALSVVPGADPAVAARCACPFCTGSGTASVAPADPLLVRGGGPAQDAYRLGGGGTSAANATKWPQPGGLGSQTTITYSYANLLDGGMGLSADALRAAVEEALGRWAAVAPLRFVEVTDSGPAYSANQTDYSASGRPMLRFGHIPIDGRSNVLAYAYYPGSTGLAGDIFFDDSERWTLNPSTGMDLLEVAVHELGHALGLDHEPMPSSGGNTAILNPYYGGRYSGLGTSYLFQDDIDGIRALYGTGTGSVQGSGTVGAPNPNPRNAALPFSDSFARADSVHLGQEWTDIAGDMQLVSGRAANVYGSLATSLLNGVSRADVYAEADIALAARSGQLAGLLTRFSSDG
ncbi:MAG: matrixin family metalloprotease, partial [Gemmataceae bacterium]|nr:matrixin family metalloprotease [Gemmataceae bacterium]